jgi:phosphohistidine swiveling domain-containing protein
MADATPLPPPRNFPFTWDDPADAQRYWVTDLHHNAYPRVPLSGALGDAFPRGMGRAFGEGDTAPPPRRLTINGYVYTEVTPPRAGPPSAAARPRVDALAQWETVVRPEVETITAPLKDFPYDDVALPEIVAHVLALPDAFERLGTLHHRAVIPSTVAKRALATFLDGLGVPPADQDAIVHGVENLSLAASCELWDLGRGAAADPALHALLATTPPAAIEARLRGVGGGAAADLLAGAEAHVRRFGWRPALLHPFSLPVVDDRTPVWEAVRAAATGGGPGPRERHAAVARRREALATAVRARLNGEPREQFERLYAAALPYIRIMEDHNVLIDQVVVALVRRACHRLARRLHARGLVAHPHDAYFLEPDELRALDLERPHAPLMEMLAARRRDWERWCTYTPPVALGTRPPAVDEFQDQFLGRTYAESGNPRLLAGTPASAGIATGIARVLRDMDEADRLGPGEVLVCITTLPPWTPLFARAAAVVTVGGGTLSHAAITAREFGIPAVLSVADATTLIPDGRRVTVDGTNGLVRIED